MHSNKPLDTVDTLFRFRGRTGRLAFIGYNIAIGLAALIFYLVAFAVAGFDEHTNSWFALACLVLPFSVAMWSGAALLSKRLHDMNFSGLHAMWIIAIWYGAPLLPSPFAVIMTYLCLPLGLCLIFVPGSGGPNRYGHKAGMVLVPHDLSLPKTA